MKSMQVLSGWKTLSKSRIEDIHHDSILTFGRRTSWQHDGTSKLIFSIAPTVQVQHDTSLHRDDGFCVFGKLRWINDYRNVNEQDAM
jgi:hypothetical protein